MATKELEDRIAALEAQIEILKAQKPVTVLPRPADVPWPYPYQPYWAVPPTYPTRIFCGTKSSPASTNYIVYNDRTPAAS